MSEKCVHCGAPITRFNYALGPEWMHYNPGASFPSVRMGTAWRHCRVEVATPPAALTPPP